MKTKTPFVITVVLFLTTLLFAQDSKLISQLQYGVGFGIGIINPTDFYEYVDRYAEDDSYKSTTSLDNISFSPRLFLGYRIINLTFHLVGEFALSTRTVYSGDRGGSFYFNRLSYGVEANYYIPLKRKIGLLAGGGILKHKIYIENDDRTVFSGETLGYRIQVGFNFLPSQKFILQGLIAYNHARAKDNSMDLNYSGLNIRFNMILGLDIF